MTTDAPEQVQQLPTRLRYRCVLCPQSAADAPGTPNAIATFDHLADARTHLVAYHRIDPALLHQIDAEAPISLRIGSLQQTGTPWILPKYGTVIEPYHDHLLAESAGDERSDA